MAPRFPPSFQGLPQQKAGFTQVVVVLSLIVLLLGSSAVAVYYFPNNPLVKAGKQLIASLPLRFWPSAQSESWGSIRIHTKTGHFNRIKLLCCMILAR
jgi:hypothetical protein